MEIKDLYKIFLQHPSVQTDTRKLKEGDIFFALKGPNFNGNVFAKQAFDAGAVYAVVDEPGSVISEHCILVNDVLSALQELALYHRQQFNIPFIAITGSNGKTTTKELVTAVLKKKYRTYATQGNLNNHIGVPLTILSIPMSAEMAIIEMGANHQKEIASYCVIALPTHGIITNCGKAHIEGFGGVEGVRKGKGELYDFIRQNGGSIFRNADLSYLQEMSNGVGQQITYGTANATYIGKPLTDDVFLKVVILNKDAETTITTNLVGEYNYPNVMTAVAVGMHFGVGIDDIKAAIAEYTPDNSRSQLVEAGSNKLILDAYNANPTSMRAAIINFAKTEFRDKILMLGGMKEMGEDEHKEHAELIALIKEYEWMGVILVGKEFSDVKERYTHFNTSAEAAEYVKAHKPEYAAILIKGSRGSKMELLADVLK